MMVLITWAYNKLAMRMANVSVFLLELFLSCMGQPAFRYVDMFKNDLLAIHTEGDDWSNPWKCTNSPTQANVYNVHLQMQVQLMISVVDVLHVHFSPAINVVVE